MSYQIAWSYNVVLFSFHQSTSELFFSKGNSYFICLLKGPWPCSKTVGGLGCINWGFFTGSTQHYCRWKHLLTCLYSKVVGEEGGLCTCCSRGAPPRTCYPFVSYQHLTFPLEVLEISPRNAVIFIRKWNSFSFYFVLFTIIFLLPEPGAIVGFCQFVGVSEE